MSPYCSTGPVLTGREFVLRLHDRCVRAEDVIARIAYADLRGMAGNQCRAQGRVALGPVCQRLHDYATEAEMFVRLAGVWDGR